MVRSPSVASLLLLVLAGPAQRGSLGQTPSSHVAAVDRSGRRLNVVLLVGGKGERFLRAGWTVPKAMLPVPTRDAAGRNATKPMILWLLDSLCLDARKHALYVAYHTSLRAHGFVETLVSHWQQRRHATQQAEGIAVEEEEEAEDKAHNCSQGAVLPPMLLHEVSYRTRGAAETALSLLHAMTPAALLQPTLTLDCDVGYSRVDILRQLEVATAGTAAAAGSSPSARAEAGGWPVGARGVGLNALFYTIDTDPEPRFSYLRLSGTDADSVCSTRGMCPGLREVRAIVEKRKISDFAVTGAYAFESAQKMRETAERTIGRGVRGMQKGEFYLSSLFAEMLQQSREIADASAPDARLPVGAGAGAGAGARVWGLQLRADALDNIGTPEQLRAYTVRRHLSLTTPPPAGATAPSPVTQEVTPLRAHGLCRPHVLVTSAGDVSFPKGEGDATDRVARACLDEAREEFAIEPRAPNRLHFNRTTVHKTSADAMEIAGQLWFYRELGRRCATLSHVRRSPACRLFPRLLGFSVGGQAGEWSITTERVRGLTFSHLFVNGALLPVHLTGLLSGLRALHEDLGETSVIEDSRRGSDTIAALVIPSLRCGDHLICRGRGVGATNGSVPLADHSFAYDNYARKIQARYQQHSARGGAYAELELELEAAGRAARGPRALHDKILPFLQEYEAQRRGRLVASHGVVHGDPVFTNVLLQTAGGDHDDKSEDKAHGKHKDEDRDSAAGVVRLVDMRGRLGPCCSALGDALYDYAKVYQSLCGYDHVLHGRSQLLGQPGAPHDAYATRLRAVLRAEIVARFGNKNRQVYTDHRDIAGNSTQESCAGNRSNAAQVWYDVRKLAASLFFSLLPLHTRIDHRRQYLELAWRVWQADGDDCGKLDPQGRL